MCGEKQIPFDKHKKAQYAQATEEILNCGFSRDQIKIQQNITREVRTKGSITRQPHWVSGAAAPTLLLSLQRAYTGQEENLGKAPGKDQNGIIH